MKTITGRPAPGALLLDPENNYRPLPADEDSTLPRNAHWVRSVKRGDFLPSKPAAKTQPKQAAEKAFPKLEEEKN